jgi:hypothetical protein
MTDEEWIRLFEACAIPNAAFHHRDHVRTAFLYLSRYPATQALERFSTSLARFARAHGKPERYNETITWAYLFLIRERMAREAGRQSWPEFARENGDLLDWTDSILAKYYRPETLTSDLAKRVFLFPDKF